MKDTKKDRFAATPPVDMGEAPRKIVVPSGPFIAVKGVTYGDPERRIEPGEDASGLPAEDIQWLFEQGCIKPAEVK